MPRRTQRDERTHHQGTWRTWRVCLEHPRPAPEGPRRRPQAERSPDFVSDHAARDQFGRVGESFARGDGQPVSQIKVGAKSSGACELQGAQVEVQDETGARIGVGTLGETPWVDTGALYWTEVDLAAPMKEGVVSWSVRFAPAAQKIPHDGSAAEFSFATVRPPEHSVTVKVVEKGTGVPIADAQVRVGAHRASTDESGLATLKTSSGTYDVVAWKGGYQSPSMTVAVTEDVGVQIEAAVIPKVDPCRPI